MRWLRVAILVVVLVSAGWSAPPLALAQCPMCKTGLISSPEGQKMAGGFNQGILLLVGVPFLLVGAVAWKIVSAQRRIGYSLPDT